jgi:imidazoleglycerol-phosphate dehydratase
MRFAELNRTTNETKIDMSLNLDGNGRAEIDTGIGFFNHMLELFAHHGKFDLTVKCKGDIDVDGHHTVEDIGIVLGKLLAKTTNDKKGIARYACSYVPMDESLCRTVVDFGGRPFLSFNAEICGTCGDFDASLTEEFLRAVVSYGMFTMHVDLIRGKNLHHKIEAIFKSFAKALSSSLTVIGGTIPSSKGVIE